uniref:Uncharacterized protein n=1 Tax=Arcella intermedia TaxID=1963864 RepID=A0A6B2LM99_9EUKA|eukprot:TRINITY_DN11399_c0_g3_i1.p1 TRINITY_DN11399_c0_g3~~TRINITY_DN11399_c0_g3_i1.p1  ORF type:complete len:176 (-),score=54.90 TRINITY_DN11399_c0_g3_i1:14-541(-)
MLNTTFAIIVDTFGHLRERETVAQQALTSNCFICCLERDVFHKKAKDFTTHIEREHNRLHYFYFFAYLKDSETKRSHSDLSLLEQDVKKMVNQKKFLKFFPIGKASSLEAPEEDQVNEKLLSSVKNIERQIQQSAKQQEKLFKQTTDANRQLQFLFFHLKKTQEELEAVKEKFKK